MDGSNLCEGDFYKDGSRKLDCNRICNHALKSGDLKTEFNSNCRDLCSACWEKIVEAWSPSLTPTTTVASQDSTFGPTSVTPATTDGSPDSLEMFAYVMKDIVLPAVAASAALGLVLFGAYKVYQHFRKGQCSKYVDIEAAKALIKAKNEKMNTPTGDTLSITMNGTNKVIFNNQQVIPRPDAPRSPSPPPSPSVSEKEEEDEENIGHFPGVPEDSAEPSVPQDATSSETEHAQPEDAAQATPEATKEFQEVTDDEKPPHDVIPDNEDSLA